MKYSFQSLTDRLLKRGAKTQPGQFRAHRAKLIQIAVYCGFTAIVGRAVMLHLFPSQGSSLHQIADRQYQRDIDLAPYRGTIFDRRGDPLAISIHRPSIAVNPRAFDPGQTDIRRLARILKMSPRKVERIATRKSYFAWLARHLDSRVADEVMNLGLTGLVQIREPARFYPAGGAAAHLLGFTGMDNGGLAGLERQYDRDLKGQAFKITATKDAHGQFIFNETQGAAPEKSGNNIYLTIDRVIQEIAEDELEAGLKRAHAKQGFVIVSDPHTGRILAVANGPSFDPNGTRDVASGRMRNHAFVDVYEPGSVTKTFIIAAALDKKKTTADEQHDCEKGVLAIGRHRIHDDHPADHLTTGETLIHSSNICAFKIAMKLGKEGTFNALKMFGITTRDSSLGFPGEVHGYLTKPDKWAQVAFSNIAFGQGFLTTGLEVTQAMGAIANGGRLMKPTLIEKVVSSEGLVVSTAPSQAPNQVISPSTARTMRGFLERVVVEGTGSNAATALYTTAGKTGTAQKVDPGIRGYDKDKRIASFIGFAPVQDPHLVIYVVVDEPHEKPYYGGTWAAPIFSAVAERTLKYLNVAPDKPAPDDKAGKGRVAKGKSDGPDTRKL